MAKEVNWAYQKALDRINHSMWNQDMETTEYVAILQAALEKQIPKKPVNIFIEDGIEYWNCPRCGIQYSNERNSYCCVCGQKLGW